MSLDDLRSDLKRNIVEAKACSTVEGLRDHMVNTLWPTLEALLDEVDEIDEAVADLVDQNPDYLNPETAAIFAAHVQSSQALSADLRKRAVGDDVTLKRLDAHDQLSAQVAALLGEITMLPADDQGGADDDDGDTDE